MYYKEALLARACHKLNNVDFIMVAPQELYETSCDPKTKRFTVIRRGNDRKSNVLKAVIKKMEDENIPHVKIVDKKLTVINYTPTSLYTARTLARSQQSH